MAGAWPAMTGASEEAREQMREHIVDGAKASPVLAYITAMLGGIPLNELATLAALVYTLILIWDKLRQMGVFRKIAAWFSKYLW